jgi:hypothetical protein
MSSKSGRENGDLKVIDLKSLSESLYGVYNQFNENRLLIEDAKTLSYIAKTIVCVKSQELNEKKFKQMINNKNNCEKTIDY